MTPTGELGTWLRNLRKAAGLTQPQVAAASGHSERTIKRWENEGPPAYFEKTLRLLEAFGAEVRPDLKIDQASAADLRALAVAEGEGLVRILRRLAAQEPPHNDGQAAEPQ